MFYKPYALKVLNIRKHCVKLILSNVFSSFYRYHTCHVWTEFITQTTCQ